MNPCAIRSTLIGSLGVALALACGAALATTFQVTDLGTLEGSSSTGVAMNASGQVTGYFDPGDPGDPGDPVGPLHAFLWDGTTMRDLGTLGGAESFVFAINASGTTRTGATALEES